MPLLTPTSIRTASSPQTGLPPDQPPLTCLKIKPGDDLALAATANGDDRLLPHTDDFSRQMSLAERIMQEDQVILHTLSR